MPISWSSIWNLEAFESELISMYSWLRKLLILSTCCDRMLPRVRLIFSCRRYLRNSSRLKRTNSLAFCIAEAKSGSTPVPSLILLRSPPPTSRFFSSSNFFLTSLIKSCFCCVSFYSYLPRNVFFFASLTIFMYLGFLRTDTFGFSTNSVELISSKSVGPSIEKRSFYAIIWTRRSLANWSTSCNSYSRDSRLWKLTLFCLITSWLLCDWTFF